MIRPAVTVIALSVPAIAAAAPASFFDALAAYEADQPGRCADILLDVETAGGSIPAGGELLTAECLSAAGRFDDAFAALRRQLPRGRIDLAELVGKSRPGLEALRRQPGWPALREQAEALEADRAIRRDETLRTELLQRAAVDQSTRQAAFVPDAPPDSNALSRMAEVDRDNTRWLAEVLETRGWPGNDLVGNDGANAAWLLVQHADHDPAFQRRALALMQQAGTADQVEPADVAMLTDRALLAEGQPQRYGTQFERGDDGVLRMRPTEAPETLDARRAAVNLPPMAEYRQLLRDMYGQPVE